MKFLLSNFKSEGERGGGNSKMYRQELLFLRFACQLIMLYISMKLHENILKGFKL